VKIADYGALPVAVVKEPCKIAQPPDQADPASLSPSSETEVEWKIQDDSSSDSGSDNVNDSDSDDESSEDEEEGDSPYGMMAAVRPSLSHLRSLPEEDEEEDVEDMDDGLSERTKFSSFGGANSVAEEPAISVEMEKEKENEKEENEQVDQAPRRSSMRRPSAQWLRKMRQSAPALMVLDQRQHYMRSFLQADAVYCSPLTRALQTALVLLEGHPALELGGLTLASSIREVKALGGMDSVGVEVGLGIWERLHEQLSARLGPEHCDELMAPLSHGGFHSGDCDSQWWSPAASFEGHAEVDERVMDFLSLVRYCPHSHPIFVGHSLFFKALCSTRVSRMLDKNRPLLAERLGNHRLSNATVLALTVVFTDDGSGGGGSMSGVSAGTTASSGPKTDEAVILDADVLFGGSFAAHGHHHHNHLHDHHDHHDHHDAHHEAEEGQSLPPPPTPASPSTPATGSRASIVSSIKGLGQGLGQGMAGAMQSMPSFLRGRPKDK
jgi:broad specificity phosphatase PhoE